MVYKKRGIIKGDEGINNTLTTKIGRGGERESFRERIKGVDGRGGMVGRVPT